MRIDYVNLGGITTTADGEIEYDFQGHISALGIDITADDTGDPRTTLQNAAINWDRLSDGDQVATINARTGTSPFEVNHLALSANTNTGPSLGTGAGIDLRSDTGAIALIAGALNRRLIDGNGDSQYAQIAGQPAAFVIDALYAVDFTLAPGAGTVATIATDITPTFLLGAIAYPHDGSANTISNVSWAYALLGGTGVEISIANNSQDVFDATGTLNLIAISIT